MTRAAFRLEPLGAAHDRAVFDCGAAPLDRYLREQVMQDVRRHIAACFVALTDQHHIAAYYTLAAASIALNQLPAELARKLPRYPAVPAVPAVRLGRLAVDRRFKGRGLGGALLPDAIDRTQRAEIAAFALLVDAKDEAAAAFYRHHGFIAFSQSRRTLFLPLANLSAH
ncbi:GNAT family N-acetyltransferase [Duganella sp. FT3S]|uniref:GNAT family N-acetyltransferase n=1 Tax=Rugamonas fusca TaxID=2758568 RepID=A0A7W2EMG7_9BURK|nr:GNAT family N-acetyltransferase [Rugamonas fusca]MBA5608603.1 GNAT family N-acetyltransferase [Rugamonas fusca]